MYGTVISTRQLAPRLLRVVLGGEGLADFEPSEFADSYVNCFFVPAGADYSVPFDTEQVHPLPREQRPYPRRYTVREWRAGELTLDLVVHGDVGHAGRWAQHARPGDRLQFNGPGGGYLPHPEADGYLFVGDESALPAIAVCCERVPAGRPVTAVIEVDDPSHAIDLTSPGELSLVWVPRTRADGPALSTDELEHLLETAVSKLAPMSGRISAFVHGEAMSTRLVRRYLLAAGLVDADWLSCSPYWRRGLDDEQWRRIKKDFGKQTLAG